MANVPWQTSGWPALHGGTRSRPFPDRDVGGVEERHASPSPACRRNEAFKEWSAGEYLKHCFIHTNGLDGTRSLLKRQVRGIHHLVSMKHLDRCLGEFTFRYNRRQTGKRERTNDFFGRTPARSTYESLIA